MHFTFRQAEAFLAVAESGSFTRAAEMLHLSPSAVSQLMNELESALNYTVFDRTTRRVALSTAGRALLPAMLALGKQIAITKTTALDIRYQTAGVVRVAAPLVVACSILPPLIARYAALHPGVLFRIVDCAVEQLAEKVACREADLALGPDRPVGSDVEHVFLYPSPWVVWCAPDHPFASMENLAWKDLATSRLVAAGRDHETHLASIFHHLPAALRVTPSQVVDNITTALGMAAAGLCFTLSPAYVQALALPLGLVMREITGPVVAREMSLFRPAERMLSPAAAAFATHLIQALTKR